MDVNSIRPWRSIDRRNSRKIMVGSVPVGGGSPITVQTMTNTLTTDIKATINQIHRCTEAGADMIRVSIPDKGSAKALKEIVTESTIPIIADIHFHYLRAVEAADGDRRARHGHGAGVPEPQHRRGQLRLRPPLRRRLPVVRTLTAPSHTVCSFFVLLFHCNLNFYQ